MIQIKHGVEIEHLTPQALLGIVTVAWVMSKYNYDFVLTSGREGNHMPGSLHPSGRAFDFRTHHILSGHRDRIFTESREALGPEFDVLYENGKEPHGHCEWDPDYLKRKKQL